MKKILMLAACTAAMTAITSCSSNDDDVLPQAPDAGKAVAPETTDAPKGTPFSVVVTDDSGNTRATLLNGTTLENFKLYGKNTAIEDVDKQMWINGNVFKYGTAWAAYDAAGTNAADLTWPLDGQNKSLTTATQFWAVSDNSATGVTLPSVTTTSRVTTNDIANSQSFMYEFYVNPNASTLQYGRKLSNTRTETTVLDLSKQSDLLVASASQAEGANGQLSLGFRHALASLAIKARFTSTENGETTGINEGSLKIYWIRIHGLKGGGTFTFPTTDDYNSTTHRWGTSPWTTAGGTDVVYEVVFDTPLVIDAQAHVSGDITKTDLITHTNMMVIPQTFTPWVGHADPSTENDVPGAGAYVEMSVEGDGTDITIKRTAAFLPLIINKDANTGNCEILTGVKHTITLNLNYIMHGYGDYILEPSQIQTNG